MVIICLPSGVEWYKANWVFRRLSADVAKAYPNDIDLIFEMRKSEAFGMLDFPELDHALALRLYNAMKSVVKNVVDSNASSIADADDTTRMYVESMIELLEMMNEKTT